MLFCCLLHWQWLFEGENGKMTSDRLTTAADVCPAFAPRPHLCDRHNGEYYRTLYYVFTLQGMNTATQDRFVSTPGSSLTETSNVQVISCSEH